jgi:hypothetical protein
MFYRNCTGAAAPASAGRYRAIMKIDSFAQDVVLRARHLWRWFVCGDRAGEKREHRNGQRLLL